MKWFGLHISLAALLALLWNERHRLKLVGVRALKPSIEEMSGLLSADADIFPERTIPRENARICNLSWFDDTIYLSDTDFSHCQFIRCKLIDDGGPFSMEDCFIESCTIRSANAVEPQPANVTAIDKPNTRGLESSSNLTTRSKRNRFRNKGEKRNASNRILSRECPIEHHY